MPLDIMTVASVPKPSLGQMLSMNQLGSVFSLVCLCSCQLVKHALKQEESGQVCRQLSQRCLHIHFSVNGSISYSYIGLCPGVRQQTIDSRLFI